MAEYDKLIDALIEVVVVHARRLRGLRDQSEIDIARQVLVSHIEQRTLTDADVLAFKAFFEAGIDWSPEFQALRLKLRERAQLLLGTIEVPPGVE